MLFIELKEKMLTFLNEKMAFKMEIKLKEKNNHLRNKSLWLKRTFQYFL